MKKRYKNPPIQEAVCEFRLKPDSKWDITVPGLIYEKLREEFPNKKKRINRGIQKRQTSKDSKGEEYQIITDERIQFLAKDKKSFVQIGSGILSINCLDPYPGWDLFRPQIKHGFDALTSVVEFKELHRVGLRYINRIELAGTRVELENYFQFRPFLGQDVPQEMERFIVGCEVLPDGKTDICRVQLTDARPRKSGNAGFLLDIDYSPRQLQNISADKALEWVEQAHNQIEKIFEACICDSLRKIFEEVE